MFLQNEKFKKIFPRACRQMEENLSKFIEANKITTNTSIATGESSTNGTQSPKTESDSRMTSAPPKLMRRLSMNSSSNSTHICLDPAGRFIQNQVRFFVKLSMLTRPTFELVFVISRCWKLRKTVWKSQNPSS